MDALIDFGKVLLPAALVLYACFLFVRSFIQKEIDLRTLEVRSRAIETVLPNRLHAYERMALFLERMSPQNLLIRINTGPMSAREFQQLLLAEIRNEYNHNVSQQIYIGEAVWEQVKNAKEDLVVMINDAAQELSSESTGLDLAKKIIEKTLSRQVDPMAHALTELKAEIQRTF